MEEQDKKCEEKKTWQRILEVIFIIAVIAVGVIIVEHLFKTQIRQVFTAQTNKAQRVDRGF